MHITLPDILHGAAAGAFGGLLATVVMLLAEEGLNRVLTPPARASSAFPAGEAALPAQNPPPVRLAALIARKVFGHPLAESEKRRASLTLQFGFGALAADGYGGTAEALPRITVGYGALLGIGLWLAGDEIVAPMLGVAPSPRQTPLRQPGVTAPITVGGRSTISI